MMHARQDENMPFNWGGKVSGGRVVIAVGGVSASSTPSSLRLAVGTDRVLAGGHIGEVVSGVCTQVLLYGLCRQTKDACDKRATSISKPIS